VSKRWWVRAAVAVCGLGTLTAAGCNRNQAPVSAGPETAMVETRTIDVRVEATGQIQPIRIVEVKSKASGEVLQIHVETGDNVQQGTLLAAIDPRDVRNALAQAEADLAVAQARLQTSVAQKERAEELRKANVVTEQEYEAALLDEANSRAQLIKAETNVELARERMGDVTIRAPLAGTIIARTVEIGQIIQSASANISGGSTLLIMADLSEMQVRALIDETDLGRISAGQSVRVSVEAYPTRQFVGAVLKVEPQAVVEQNVTMFPVLVRLDNRDMLLKPGMNADVQIEIARRENAVAVPSAAVVSSRDAIAAGSVLGLSEDVMQTALRGGAPENGAALAVRMGGDSAGETPTRDAGAAAPATAAAAHDGAAECETLRTRLREGGFTALSDADREKLRACRPQGGPGAFGGRGQTTSSADTRPGVVFIRTATGIEPRAVVLGVNDWEFTEVVSGLQGGEEVVLVSVAQLQRAQEEFNARMRERMGGFPGAGGPAGGRR
jgi:HlyD family secretion protein